MSTEMYPWRPPGSAHVAQNPNRPRQACSVAGPFCSELFRKKTVSRDYFNTLLWWKFPPQSSRFPPQPSSFPNPDGAPPPMPKLVLFRGASWAANLNRFDSVGCSLSLLTGDGASLAQLYACRRRFWIAMVPLQLITVPFLAMTSPHRTSDSAPAGRWGLYTRPFWLLFSPVVRPPYLAVGGVQLPLPDLKWSERSERT